MDLEIKNTGACKFDKDLGLTKCIGLEQEQVDRLIRALKICAFECAMSEHGLLTCDYICKLSTYAKEPVELAYLMFQAGALLSTDLMSETIIEGAKLVKGGNNG